MTKVVIVDQDDRVMAAIIGPTGAEHRHQAMQVMDEAVSQAGLTIEQLGFIVATGYGRINVPFADKQITEITCHARCLRFLFPCIRTIIDIGGQDSKGIKLDAAGKVANFVMNDKRAAGTGRFLDVMADTLGIKLGDMGKLSLKARQTLPISSTCTVFAEHEVVSRLSEGAEVADIIAGLHAAIAKRVVNMVCILGVERDVAFTGGGAKNAGLVKAIEEKIGCKLLVASEPLITGAFGAALLGKELAARGFVPERKRKLEAVTFFN